MRNDKSQDLKLENLPTQMTLNWNPRFNSLRSIWVVILSKPTWLRGYTDCWGACRSMVAMSFVKESDGEREGALKLERWSYYYGWMVQLEMNCRKSEAEGVPPQFRCFPFCGRDINHAKAILGLVRCSPWLLDPLKVWQRIAKHWSTFRAQRLTTGSRF